MTRRSLGWTVLAVLVSLAIALPTLTAVAAKPTTLMGGATKETLVKGLANPIDMAFAPDGRLFVLEQKGRVRIVRSDGTLKTFLNIKAKVDHTAGRGLLGIAFDPNFETNGYLYLDYTKKASSTQGPHTVVVRVTGDGNKAIPGSERELLRLDRQKTPNHTGGAMAFGADGKLYISTGDNEHPELSQKLSSTMGKILRINPSGKIPSSNPFFDRAKGRKRAIWARGLRNPFKMDIDLASGRMIINDVGENTREEINIGRAGANYGWPIREGWRPAARMAKSFDDPVIAYQHGSGARKGCAITAGTFYRPTVSQFPSTYTGDYLFADYCSGWVRRFDPVHNKTIRFANHLKTPVLDIEVDDDGNVFLLQRGKTGKILKVQG